MSEAWYYDPTKVLSDTASSIGSSVSDVVSAAVEVVKDPLGMFAEDDRYDDLDYLAELVRKNREQIERNREELHKRGIKLNVDTIKVPTPDAPVKFPDWVTSPYATQSTTGEVTERFVKGCNESVPQHQTPTTTASPRWTW